MGNERACLAARGVSLAPRGSARDTALREVLRRERSERFAAIQLFAQILGAGLRLDDAKIDALLDLYLLELSQDRYRPKIVAAARAARAARRQKAMADRKLLERVDKYGVSDEDMPEPKGGKKRKSGR